MKLNIDLSALLAQPKKMGDTVVREWVVIGGSLPPPEPKGTKLQSLGDLRVVDGLLAYGNAQVVLYIQDHSFKYERALLSPRDANRFHIAECKTIQDMRASGKFERYVVTNNASGKFYAANGHGGGECIRLIVCMNCLEKLNYQGYRQKIKSERYQMVSQFQADEFFEKYSSFFGSFPRRQVGGKEGYTDDWAKISRQMREAAGFCCQECKVDLSAHQRLLHTHHINGVKHDNSTRNLKVLCIDCHSKEPNHKRMHVPRKDRLTVSRLRSEQTQVNIGSGWGAIARYADPAVEGLIYHCRASGIHAPDKYGMGLMDNKGEVVANLELAWLGPKVGIAVSAADREAATRLGWNVFGVNDTIERIDRLRYMLS